MGDGDNTTTTQILLVRHFCLLTNQFCLQKNMVNFNGEFLYLGHVFTLLLGVFKGNIKSPT